MQDPRWPETYRNTLFTGDWGRSEVYRHDLKPNGADVRPEAGSVPEDAAGDGHGHRRRRPALRGELARAARRASTSGPNVGFVARVTPKGLEPTPFPDLKEADLAAARRRAVRPRRGRPGLHARARSCAAGGTPETTRALVDLASDAARPLQGRVAAIFTLKQLDGKDRTRPC